MLPDSIVTCCVKDREDDNRIRPNDEEDAIGETASENATSVWIFAEQVERLQESLVLAQFPSVFPKEAPVRYPAHGCHTTQRHQ